MRCEYTAGAGARACGRAAGARDRVCDDERIGRDARHPSGPGPPAPARASPPRRVGHPGTRIVDPGTTRISTVGAPEGIELVDLLMRHLDLDYYVGGLSAAAIHGASHQAPQVFQVATSRHVRDRQVGRTRFQFLMRRATATVATIAHPTRSGTAQVSSREVTMLDVAADLDIAGGIGNAATVVIELAEDRVYEAELANLTSDFPAAAGRRIGWLLEERAGHDPLDAVNAAVVGRVIEPSWLDPSGPRIGSLARRWQLRVNHEIDEEAS